MVAAEREQARRAAETYGLPRQVAPHEALLEELHRTAGHVAWLGHKVGALEEGELHEQVGGAAGGFASTEPAVWLRLYQQERKHLADVAKTCVSVGIAERQVRIAEQQGVLLARVIQGVLADLGVADRPEVPAVVRQHLTSIEGQSG